MTGYIEKLTEILRGLEKQKERLSRKTTVKNRLQNQPIKTTTVTITMQQRSCALAPPLLLPLDKQLHPSTLLPLKATTLFCDYQKDSTLSMFFSPDPSNWRAKVSFSHSLPIKGEQQELQNQEADLSASYKENGHKMWTVLQIILQLLRPCNIPQEDMFLLPL